MFNQVPGGVNAVPGGFHGVIHLDALVDLQAQGLGQGEVRPHPGGDEHQVAFDLLPALQVDRQAGRSRRDLLRLGPQVKAKAHVLHLPLQDGGAGHVHLPGERLGKKLHHHDLEAQLAQAVAGLEAQEAAAITAARRGLLDPVGIGQGPAGVKTPGESAPRMGGTKELPPVARRSLS